MLFILWIWYRLKEGSCYWHFTLWEILSLASIPGTNLFQYFILNPCSIFFFLCLFLKRKEITRNNTTVVIYIWFWYFRERLESTKNVLEPVPIIGFLTGMFDIVFQFQMFFYFSKCANDIVCSHLAPFVMNLFPCRQNSRSYYWSSDTLHLHVRFIRWKHQLGCPSYSSIFLERTIFGWSNNPPIII